MTEDAGAELFDVRLASPRLKLLPQENRLMLGFDAHGCRRLEEAFGQRGTASFEGCSDVRQKRSLGHAHESGDGQKKRISAGRLQDSRDGCRRPHVFGEGCGGQGSGTQGGLVEQRFEFVPWNLGTKRV